MATITIPASASEKFPVGTTIGLYPQATRVVGIAPIGTPTATGVMTATGVAIAGVNADQPYIAYAFVNSEHRYMQVRNSSHDSGTAIGTGNTTSGSTALATVAATVGAFAIGQRISGPGIPPGTYLKSGSGASWTMSDKATATATGIALQAEGASPAQTELGGTLVPRKGRWQARVAQRRALAGTS